jgi:hypothetical protein
MRPSRTAIRRVLSRATLVLACAIAGYGALLLHPQPLFAFSARDVAIVLHAREPLPPEVRGVLADARRRVEASPFYDPRATYDAFLCDDVQTFTAFTLWNRGAGAVSQWDLTGNIFLRPSHVERNRLVGRSGNETPGERTLSYFIAHEVTHTMLARRIGRLHYARLQRWQVEGYADYVGKAGEFDFEKTLAAFRAGTRELDPKRSGLYLRYHLLVSYLLDHEGMSPETLLARPIPQDRVERALREGVTTGVDSPHGPV